MAATLAIDSQAILNPRQLARKTAGNPALLDEIMRGLDADSARVKYGCAKALRILSQEKPEVLYPHFDFFAGLLDHRNKILQWEAFFVLSQLARVDSEERVSAIFERYFLPIRGPVMITAANVIQGGARIARAKPQLADRIAGQMLKVGRARYQTTECRNVAIGHTVVALGEILDLLGNCSAAIRFARRQLKNSRPATRKKAEQFLKRVQRHAAERKA